MKLFMRTVLATVVILMIANAHSEVKKIIQFENQREEIFDLENFLKDTRYKEETIDSTCYRQEPYVENVCRDVTRYRQVCNTIPSHQECRTVYEPICRTENRYETECRTERGAPSCRVIVRYRQECSQTSGGRQCRTIPGDVVCRRNPNGENRCEKIPPREVCENTPGRQECRQVPYEERECTDGPSRQVCHQVNRPYEVCDNRSRQQCDWIPARNECSQVPYSVNECKDETLYRSIPYVCKQTVQVPYEVILKTHQANVQVLFSSFATEARPTYVVSLDEKGLISVVGTSEDKTLVALMTKNIILTPQNDVSAIKAVFSINHLSLADLFSVSKISDVDLNKRSLSFEVNGKFDARKTTLFVKISKKDRVKFEKTLKSSQFKSSFDGINSRVYIDLESLGAPRLGGFNKTHTVNLKLKLDLSSADGEVIFPKMQDVSVSTNVEAEVN